MLKIFRNWFKGIKVVQLCACSHFSGYTTNRFTCRLTYLAPLARAQFLVKLGGMPPNLFLSCDFFPLSFFLYPAGVSGRVLYLTRFFLLLLLSSSGNTSKTYSFDMPWPISTKLGHKNPWPMAFMSYDQNGVKGHVGVTGVKKVKNSKKRYSSYRLQGMITWLMYMHQLDHFYKSYHFKNSSGVIWGHRGQKVIFTKNAITHPC